MALTQSEGDRTDDIGTTGEVGDTERTDETGDSDETVLADGGERTGQTYPVKELLEDAAGL
jgi:hypothetical protein